MRFLTATEIDALDEVTNVIVVLWVSWSMQARSSRARADAFLPRWHESHPSIPVTMVQIDVSRQSGDVFDATVRWLDKQGVRDPWVLVTGGSGSWVWVRDGRVVAMEWVGALVDRAVDITWHLFAPVGETRASAAT